MSGAEIPIILGIAGAGTGAALDKDDPLKGAAIGGGLGALGGIAGPAILGGGAPGIPGLQGGAPLVDGQIASGAGSGGAGALQQITQGTQLAGGLTSTIGKLAAPKKVSSGPAPQARPVAPPNLMDEVERLFGGSIGPAPRIR